MKQSNIKVGNIYLFAKTNVEHRKDLIGRLVLISGKRKGRKRTNVQGGIVTGTGNAPMRFKVDWYNKWVNASELEPVPQKVKAILDSVEPDNSYEFCDQLQKRLEAVGYTFDYYLDAEPYDFRRKNIPPFNELKSVALTHLCK